MLKRRLKLMLAEDDPATLIRLRAALTERAVEVVVVRSGWEALAVLSERKPVDLVVSDLRLPEPSGIQVLSLARRVGIKVPFVLITGAVEPAVRSRAESLGARVLERPFSEAELIASIEAMAAELG